MPALPSQAVPGGPAAASPLSSPYVTSRLLTRGRLDMIPLRPFAGPAAADY
jgi:hypothetical protein